MICPECEQDNCKACVDIMVTVFGEATICKCERPNHSGDPVSQQIEDPETGAVYAPHAVIKEDGKVEIDVEWTERWRAQFE